MTPSAAVLVELDGTREELQLKKDALVKMERELKGNQSELKKIRKENEDYKRASECMPEKP